MSDKKKIIIECNPSGNSNLFERFKGNVTRRSSSTDCNISEISKGFKKGRMVMIVADGHESRSHAELLALMKQDFDKANVALVRMGKAGVSAAMAYKALMDPNKDFSGLEKIVLDSMTPIGPRPRKFAGRCYDESGEISKKTYKKMMKKLDKAEKVSHKQDQTDRWCNTWDHKIKRKL